MKVKTWIDLEGIARWHPNWSYAFQFLYDGAMDDHRASLESAKREAVPFEDQDVIKKIINIQCFAQKPPDAPRYLSNDTFYEFDFDGTVNVNDVFSHCSPGIKHYNRVARLIPAKQEEPKESQNEKPTLEEQFEFIKGAYQCYVGFPGWDGLLKFLTESQFTITRKPQEK